MWKMVVSWLSVLLLWFTINGSESSRFSCWTSRATSGLVTGGMWPACQTLCTTGLECSSCNKHHTLLVYTDSAVVLGAMCCWGSSLGDGASTSGARALASALAMDLDYDCHFQHYLIQSWAILFPDISNPRWPKWQSISNLGVTYSDRRCNRWLVSH